MQVSLPGVGGSLGECVICGKSFLYEILSGKKVRYIDVNGSELPCHQGCIKHIKKAQRSKKWEDLPEGPLRKEFEKQEAI